MFIAGIQPVTFEAPWELSFDERVRMLTRGTPRAAYFYDRPDTSTFRYRVFNVCQALAAGTPRGPSAAWFTGSELDHMERIIDLCDVLVLCRTRYSSRIARLVQHAKARGRRVLFDVDDLVFDPELAHLILDTLDSDAGDPAVLDDWFAYVGRMAAALQLCDGGIVTNPYLAARMQASFGDSRPVRVIPNFLEAGQQALCDAIWVRKSASGWARDRHIHLGYFSGTPTHNHDFALIAPTLARLMDEDERLMLRIVGFLNLGGDLARHAARVEHTPLQDYMNMERLIGQTEVNLVPLQDNIFTNCKSELKWFEAAVVGALTIATPTYTLRHAIIHGETGWLAASQNWISALRAVLHDIDSHQAVVDRARDVALDRHGHDHQDTVIISALFAS